MTQFVARATVGLAARLDRHRRPLRRDAHRASSATALAYRVATSEPLAHRHARRRRAPRATSRRAPNDELDEQAHSCAEPVPGQRPSADDDERRLMAANADPSAFGVGGAETDRLTRRSASR